MLPPHILVIDDEEDLCWALESILRPAGYIVTAAHDGAEALRLLNSNTYDVVFVDAKLPDLDGLAIAAHILHGGAYTSVILISGYYYHEDKTIVEGLQTGLFMGFVAKPFDLNEVRLLARQAVERALEAKDVQTQHFNCR
jgi:DNA-binding NtrC family response regulator